MAAVNATFEDQGSAKPSATWTPVTAADTPNEMYWPGGEGFFEMTGTIGSAVCNFQFSTTKGGAKYNIDADEHPDGAKFTSLGIAKFDLPAGYIQPLMSGTGGSLTLKVVPARRK